MIIICRDGLRLRSKRCGGEKNAPDELYKYDYIAALFMHSFSWTFMIMLVPTIYIVVCGGTWSPIVFIANLVVHMIVDDMKANKRK